MKNRLKIFVYVLYGIIFVFEMIILIANLFGIVDCYTLDKINLYTIPAMITFCIIIILLEFSHKILNKFINIIKK